MNGLSELNSFTQTPLTYTDDRDPKVTFDRGTPTNQTKNIGTGQSHTIMIGIEIIDIIKPDSLNIYIDINVSAVAGATVTVPSLNPTLTLANISSGVYRISNIDTLADWANVKTALINIPAGYQNNYNYTCTINYDPSKTKSWTTAVNVGVISLPAGTFSLTASLTGNATSVINMNTNFSTNALVGLRQQAQISSISSSSLTTTAINYRRIDAGLYALATSNVSAVRNRFILSPMSALATLSGSLNRTRYLESNLITAANQSAFIGNAYTISSSQSGHLNEYSNYYSKSNVTGATQTSGGSNRQTGNIQIYAYSSSVWSLQTTLKPDQSYIDSVGSSFDEFTQFGTNTLMNSSGDFVVTKMYNVIDNKNELYSFVRSGSSWSRSQKTRLETLGINDAYNVTWQMSEDGNYIATLNYNQDKLYILTKSGGNFSLTQTINLSAPSTYTTAQTQIAINETGSVIFVNWRKDVSNQNALQKFVRGGGGSFTLSETNYVLLPEMLNETIGGYIAAYSSDLNYLAYKFGSTITYIVDTTIYECSQSFRNSLITTARLKFNSSSPFDLVAITDFDPGANNNHTYYQITKN